MPGLIDAHCHITFGEPASNDELFFHRPPSTAMLLAAFNVPKLLRAGVTPPFRQIALPDAFLDAGALPTLHDKYGISTVAMTQSIKGWLN